MIQCSLSKSNQGALMGVLLQFNNLSKHYGAVEILSEATASFSSDQKVGVIGRNGAGKSTLCKILTGHEEPDEGKISKNSELRLAYLEQLDPYKDDESVIDFLMRYTGKEEWECAEIAGKFQLKNEILDAKINVLPGGFRTRVKLSAMLLKNPNFVILDEPTNYLDLSTLILLENFLQQFNGGFLIVSHDREFLKRTCDHTLEVENGKVTLYPGDIEDYFKFKEEQRANILAQNKQIEKKKEQLQDFIYRFRAKASTASRAKSKEKQLSKLKTIEIGHPLSTVAIKIPQVESKSGIALLCDDLSVGYPDKTIARGIRMEITRGEHVAVLGDNGQGKTTFLKTLAGDLAPQGGFFKWGSGLKIGYYAQHVFSTLHPKDDVYAHLQRTAAPEITAQDILNIAGSFLFKGDDVKKKVSVLSGGERARLCLAGLLLTKSHGLLLDEPTNHLDFETVEALGSALKSFAGTLFFISHDRTFVNLIATNIIDVKNGKITRYPGTYEDYVYHLESMAREEYPGGGLATEPSNSASKPGPAQKAKENLLEVDQQQEKKEKKELQVKLKKLESRLNHLTQERDQILKDMELNPFHFSRDRNDKLKTLKDQIEITEEEWLKFQTKIEKFK